MIALILSLSTLVVSIFAWFYIDKSGWQEEEVILNTRRLVQVEMGVKYPQQNGGSATENLDYNKVSNTQDLVNYNRNEYFIELRNINAESGFEIDLIVTPLKDLDLRVKIVEQWQIGTDIHYSPENQIKYLIQPSFSKIQENTDMWHYGGTWHEYSQVISKNNGKQTIPFVSKIKPDGGSMDAEAVLNVTLYVEVRQHDYGNSSTAWQSYDWSSSDVLDQNTQSINLEGRKEVEINFVLEQISTPYYTRGIVMVFKHQESGGKLHKTVYVYRSNESNIFTLTSGSIDWWDVELYVPDNMQYTITADMIDAQEAKITVTIRYRRLEDFIGNIDFVYSPAIIPEFVNNKQYRQNDIVYASYTVNGETRWGYFIAQRDAQYINVSNTWFWKPLGAIYQQGSEYSKGEIVYDLETKNFYVYIAENKNSTAIPNPYFWKLLGINHINGATYSVGDIVYRTQEQKYYINRYAGNTFGNYHWELVDVNYTQGEQYDQNSIVIYEGNYYRWTRSWHASSAPTTGSQDWVSAQAYQATQSYEKYDIVTYEGKGYVWNKTDDLNTQRPAPGVNSSGWKLISNDWDENSIYQAGDYVFYEGFLWRVYAQNGTTLNLDVTSIPGALFGVWEKITFDWIGTNQYKTGDYVFHNGSAWEAIYKDENGQAGNVPTRIDGVPYAPGIDATVWREVVLNWLPDR